MDTHEHDDLETGFAERWELPPPPVAPEPPPRRSLLTMRLSWKGIVLVVFAVVALRLWVMESVIVDGTSMSGTLLPNEWVLVLKPLRPHRFSVVVFRDPQEGVPVIKRVVGFPEDEVSSVVAEQSDEFPSLVRSWLQVNGTVYDEPYARSTGGSIRDTKVPPDSYYLLGDNRDDSTDSRRYGPVKRDAVTGVAVAVIYPFSRMRLIPTNAQPMAGPHTGAAP